ncbi:hypothetical protein JCM19232_5019 [Vibrio ishigakensis]|uniref:Uncharacterized protein n=1 Tax=Vibrio ishigakensis TaxID=1481914 RepID=A0A0B8PSA3_9VIBR|nr:hypothetical protein JCM19232_5019 [Vibrio ishigakensis]
MLKDQSSITAIVNKYSRVILLSAEDAQDRLWHLCVRQSKAASKVLEAESDTAPMSGRWPMTKQHYLMGTMYLLSRYLCWVEILKEEVSLLEFNDDAKTTLFNYHLKRVERTLSETNLQKLKHKPSKIAEVPQSKRNTISTDKPVFQLMQAEIGYGLRESVEDGSRCISFPQFKSNYDALKADSDAFEQLEKLVFGSMSDAKSNFCLTRLKLFANALMDLVLFLQEHNEIKQSETLEKIPIKDFDLDGYLKDWPITP